MSARSFPLTYKGRALRRKDNLIYYGTMAEKYIAVLQVQAAQDMNGLPMSSKVSVQLQLTDPDLKGRDRMVKSTEKPKDSLFDALDLACIWLDRFQEKG